MLRGRGHRGGEPAALSWVLVALDEWQREDAHATGNKEQARAVTPHLRARPAQRAAACQQSPQSQKNQSRLAQANAPENFPCFVAGIFA
jgi:hypothetical protein